MDSDSIANILALALLILASAYFSATETAFSSLNRIRLKSMAERGNKRAALALRMTDDYDRTLSTILVGNNIVNIAAASIGTILFVRHLGNAGVTVSTVVITAAVLIFGEISPKSLAKEAPEKFALFSAPILRFLTILLSPVNFLFSRWKKLLSKVVKTSEDRSITERELLSIVEEAEQGGAINEDDSLLIHSAFEFNDQVAGDILTPRVDIIGIYKGASDGEMQEVFRESDYSRIPVFDGSSDNIIGVIHLKDFFDYTMGGGKKIDDIITPVTYVAASMKISELLKRLQRTKSHLAVVADEYGGVQGIVTMEDILEELVGEIWDEHDEIIEEFQKLDDGLYRIVCSADIDEMFKFFRLSGDVDSTTVSGWIMEQLEKIPEEGDAFEYENLSITVTKTDQRRVIESTVRVRS